MDFDIHRREAVSFDAFYFEKKRTLGQNYTIQETFEHINQINLWGSNESHSGVGSSSSETQKLKLSLQKLLHSIHAKTLLDAPCGDFAWLSQIDLPLQAYFGIDILETMIKKHQEIYKDPFYTFQCIDITRDRLPNAEIILCRDALVHFSFEDLFKTLINFKQSQATYLLTTTFTHCTKNIDIITGDWRPINLEQPPFCFPKAEQYITEGCAQNNNLYSDKNLGLWRIDSLDIL